MPYPLLAGIDTEVVKTWDFPPPPPPLTTKIDAILTENQKSN